VAGNFWVKFNFVSTFGCATEATTCGYPLRKGLMNEVHCICCCVLG
jgi:hypothetical protein